MTYLAISIALCALWCLYKLMGTAKEIVQILKEIEVYDV